MRPSRKPATVHDIAKAAGVAVGSVSKALNSHPGVSPHARERILSAARDLGYSPLRKRKTSAAHSTRADAPNVGLICFGMEDALVDLPVVSAALHGIEGEVAAEGGTLMFASIPKGDRVPAFLTQGELAGVIVKGPNQGAIPPVETSELLRQIYRIPHVWLLGRPPNGEGDQVNFDAFAAGRLAANHLASKRHRRVAFLNPKPGHVQFEGVKHGFCEQSRDLGHSVEVFEPEQPQPIAWPLPAITSQERVDAMVNRWSSQPASRRATALAVGADITAVQVYSAMSRLGFKVGKDVGIVSCNDERSLIAGLTPSLTTIDVQADAIGRNAVARLLWRSKHPLEKVDARILVDPILVERASVPLLK